MKFLKKIVLLIVILSLSLTALLFLFTKTVNLDSIKNYLNREISALTQQQTAINGNISWQLFPEPGVKISQIQIGNKLIEENYSASIENLVLKLKLSPLLKGNLAFNELIINGFDIQINPNHFKPAPFSPIIVKPTLDDPKEEFAIEKILLSKGQISINKDEQIIKLDNLQIGIDDFNLQKKSFPFQLKTNLSVTEKEKRRLKTQLSFQGTTSLNRHFFSNPLTELTNLSLEGQLNLNNFIYKKFKVNSLSATTKIVENNLLLNPLSLSLYQGESVGSLNYNLSTKHLMLNQTAINLETQALIKDLFKKNLVKGRLDFSTHLMINLNDSNWLETLSGNGNIAIHQGSIEALNLNKIIDDTALNISNLMAGQKGDKKALLGQFESPDFYKGSTAFNLLSFQYSVKNGLLQNNAFVFQTDKLQLNGEGTLDLKTNNLNGSLFAKVYLDNPQIIQLQELLGGSFPLLLKGNLESPNFLPNLEKITPILSKVWLKESLTLPIKPIEGVLKLIFQK